MKIAKDTVATVAYVVTDDKGQVLGRTDPQQPVEVLVGHGFLVRGLERAIDGHQAGDEFTVLLGPSDGYGVYDVNLVQSVPRSSFGDMELQVGAIYEAQTNNGNIAVVVKEIHDEVVIVDGNHPLAGKTLNFLVSIEDVRAASAEELAHGHVHQHGVCPSDAMEEAGGCEGCSMGGCGGCAGHGPHYDPYADDYGGDDGEEACAAHAHPQHTGEAAAHGCGHCHAHHHEHHEHHEHHHAMGGADAAAALKAQ